jgi:hypothetical protein
MTRRQPLQPDPVAAQMRELERNCLRAARELRAVEKEAGRRGDTELRALVKRWRKSTIRTADVVRLHRKQRAA